MFHVLKRNPKKFAFALVQKRKQKAFGNTVTDDRSITRQYETFYSLLKLKGEQTSRLDAKGKLKKRYSFKFEVINKKLIISFFF